MKKLFCLLTALLMLLICATASSENITELFAGFEHLYVVTESEACMVKPAAKALTAYATEHNFFLPVFGRADDEMKIAVVMKGAGILFQPRHAMVETDQYRYFLDGVKEPVTMLTIEGSSYVCFILPGEAVDMCQDIAASGKVIIRYSADATHSAAAEFLLSEEAKALFGAVYEAYMTYDAVLDNDWMDSIIDGEAYEYMTYRREANPESPAAE
ncbi:MAG: hypothetical protein IKJ65_12120 [Clostridia bacterium]|nr:hypothetical protein [Clostridia bacterium]